MRYIIDTEEQTITTDQKKINLYSDEAFELISHQWLKVGWNQKYPYTFTWMGRPIIQIPEDMIRLQEAIYQVKPDVILETGIAHGGSLIYSASLCKAIGRGKVIGVDIEIRPHNLEAIQSHELYPYITLIEGSSVAPQVINQVKTIIQPTDSVLVVLDSNHTKEHVAAEIEAYHSLVTSGSYLIVTDGFMKELDDVPRGKQEWQQDNPYEAAQEFLTQHSEFSLEIPPWQFNESSLKRNITHWSDAWLKRK